MAPEPSLEAHASGWPQGDVEDEEEEGALVILETVSDVALQDMVWRLNRI